MDAELRLIEGRHLWRLRRGVRVRVIEGEPRRRLEQPVVRWLWQRQQRPIRPRPLNPPRSLALALALALTLTLTLALRLTPTPALITP